MADDLRCARCGGDAEFFECDDCGGEGETAPGALYEMDPLWYDEDATEPCSLCHGRRGWWRCCNSGDWCDAHPLPGRESVASNTLERIAPSPPEGQAQPEAKP